MWKPLDLTLKYTIHRQVLGDDPTNIDNRLNIWDYIVSVARTENFIQDAENGVRVDNSKLKLGGFLTEDTVLNGHTRQYNLSLLALKGFSVQTNQFNILSPLTVVTSGTNGTSGIKFTNINSSTTPTTGQPLGIDADGNIVVVNFSSPTCDDVNFLVNSATYKALTCGVDFDLNVVDTDDNPVGTIELPDVLRIANSEVDIAGVYTEQLLAESNLTINVTRDSSVYTPTYDDTTQTINVNCPVTPDSTLQLNGTDSDIIPAGTDINILIKQDGFTFTGWTYDDATNILDIDTCPPADDVEINLNSTLIETLSPGDVLNLSTTLDGSPTTASYSSGVININNPASSGYRGIPLGSPSQLYKIRNGDTGHAFELDAFSDANPSGFIGFNQLDGTDISGTTLVYNNSAGNKFRFTNLTGAGNSFTLVDWLGGDGITYQAKVIIDHLYSVNGTLILLTENTGRWSTTWQSRVNGATYDGSPIFSASRGILEQLIRLDTASNHLVSIMGHIGVVTSGEAVTTATTGSPIQIYNLNTNLIGVSNIATPDTKTLLFAQLW